jgi:hypothetical protein
MSLDFAEGGVLCSLPYTTIRFVTGIINLLTLYTVELGYNVLKGTKYFESLETSVVITEKYNVMLNSEELLGITEYLTLQARCRINRRRYNRVRRYLLSK